MKNYLSLIVFSHTVFALPFALIGFAWATYSTQAVFDPFLLFYVVMCMIFARSAAMAFNRYLDRDIDAKNPRTVTREIPAGVLAPRTVLGYVIANSLLFVVMSWCINPMCFALSPVALLVILGYSYTKRFAWWCHFVLGAGLALAPLGAYLAVTGAFNYLPILYAVAVLFWVSGFDIIYAMQDEAFDRSLGLHSVPVALGGKNALRLSNLLHLLCASVMIYAVYEVQQTGTPTFAWLHWLGLGAFLTLLTYQHTLVRVDDLSRVNRAFFTTNGIASVVYASFFLLDLFF
jgi:4-hydroxybenzoate polyprenyltransferase